jgi:Sporulation and spore germination
MTPRWRIWLLSAMGLAVVLAAIYLPILRRHLKQSAKIQQQTEEQAKRELTQPVIENAGQPLVKAKLFWSSGAADGTLAAITVELPLSGDPVVRAKQVLNTLLAGPADSELRSLPPDAALLEFYLLKDGTGIADFSEALATSTPSGIESEQMAVDSITQTLAANVPQIRKLKILIHGQEVETLAGHLDLTATFPVNGSAAAAIPTEGPVSATPSNAKPAAATLLTLPSSPGKLAQPASKP